MKNPRDNGLYIIICKKINVNCVLLRKLEMEDLKGERVDELIRVTWLIYPWFILVC